MTTTRGKRKILKRPYKNLDEAQFAAGASLWLLVLPADGPAKLRGDQTARTSTLTSYNSTSLSSGTPRSEHSVRFRWHVNSLDTEGVLSRDDGATSAIRRAPPGDEVAATWWNIKHFTQIFCLHRSPSEDLGGWGLLRESWDREVLFLPREKWARALFAETLFKIYVLSRIKPPSISVLRPTII